MTRFCPQKLFPTAISRHLTCAYMLNDKTVNSLTCKVQYMNAERHSLQNLGLNWKKCVQMKTPALNLMYFCDSQKHYGYLEHSVKLSSTWIMNNGYVRVRQMGLFSTYLSCNVKKNISYFRIRTRPSAQIVCPSSFI